MKLAIIRRRYNPYGGAERFIERLTLRLAERNIDTTIITESWSQTGSPSKILKISSQGFSRAGRFRSFQKSVRKSLYKTEHTLGEEPKNHNKKFDLTQSHERIPGVDIFRLGDGLHLSWLRRLQQESGIVKSLWNRFDPYHRAVIEAEHSMARDSNLQFVANSTLVQNELREILGVPDQRISLIHNGIDTQQFCPANSEQKVGARKRISDETGVNITSDTLVVGFVGSGFFRKGVFPLIQACANLKDCVLLICGKDKQSSKANSLIQRLNVTERIALTGPMSDVRPLLWASDIFALPSLYDPSSNAMLEAMSCGLPIITSQGTGMWQEISSSGAGLVCDRSPDSLLHALKLMKTQATRESMSGYARRLAKTFDSNQIADQWLRLYDSILERRS
jgi:UDP-glucose:(heptosyl)LPS alpha-1,3-glucosyltransferase